MSLQTYQYDLDFSRAIVNTALGADDKPRFESRLGEIASTIAFVVFPILLTIGALEAVFDVAANSAFCVVNLFRKKPLEVEVLRQERETPLDQAKKQNPKHKNCSVSLERVLGQAREGDGGKSLASTF